MNFSHILGINARTQLFAYKYNTFRGRQIANSKILTAKVLKKAEVAHPKIYKKFKSPESIEDFDWTSLPDRFALKPSRGLGGEGIIVVKKKVASGDAWITTQKQKIAATDLKLHVLDILEGAYSMGNVPDVAFIQEYVGRHKAFKKLAFRGTPDIRIIVFNKVPVMAMLRLPTKESGGRANLHQGAIGVGVDISTGITTKAIWHGNLITYKPGTKKRKLRGIKIPYWTKILETAARAQMVSKLSYLGVDIVLHPEKGPMVLELNAQPGLQIQLANMEGLRTRLNRVADLEVKGYEHGVKIAKAIFAGRFSDRVRADEGIKTLKSIEQVKIFSFDKKMRKVVSARIDTGATRSSIDRKLAQELSLLDKKNILWKDRYEYRSATGLQTRPVVGIEYTLAGRRIRSSVSVADRSKLKTQFLVGRQDMTGFLVDPNN